MSSLKKGGKQRQDTLQKLTGQLAWRTQWEATANPTSEKMGRDHWYLRLSSVPQLWNCVFCVHQVYSVKLSLVLDVTFVHLSFSSFKFKQFVLVSSPHRISVHCVHFTQCTSKAVRVVWGRQ